MASIDDNSLMPFGKYKGVKMANVPASYLLWFYENGHKNTYPELRFYIKENMDVLKKEMEDGKNKS